MNPFLQFDFTGENNQVNRINFHQPIRIYQTYDLEEIKSLFSAIEQDSANGFYVAGFVSYEAAPAFEPRSKVHRQPGDLPLIWFGVFDKPTKDQLLSSSSDYHVSDWVLTAHFDEYQAGIDSIKEAIENGDTYQINYTTKLRADFDGNDYSFYKQIAHNQQSSYSAYLNIGRFRILSASPELFFQIDQGKVTTKPMKGTAKRGKFLEEDENNIETLVNSEKEMAENLMIVDLLRNDLGRIAKPGTVNVSNLFSVETYPTVHQMTSEINAELEQDTTVFDWFKALFPCGSITGAPKIRTMDYIAELEQSPREVYCGAIGFISPNKQKAVFNVPIRTVVVDREKKSASYGVGSGVTWDSTATGEYEELYTKAMLLTAKRQSFHLLESLLLKNGEYPLLSYHLKRISKSASYFGFKLQQEEIINQLKQTANSFSTGDHKVRMTVDVDGTVAIESIPLTYMTQPVVCSIALEPVNRDDVFLYHKTTNRQTYQRHTSHVPTNVFSTLLWNENEECTEFTIGNLVVEKDGHFYTPPIGSGLLAGTFRQHLLEQGKIMEKIILKQELMTYERIWFINGVRGWLQVNLV
ncbi:aminodeoxychorismate synthase component I [Aquibacillus salsiterrae]|uniref:Aminodeoxychorismate synthase component I n=1 Tax=Aquibacillus salsiterrae TaxID=2950439 RepID=A0A9X3WC97_9BACI|nr:aminodeoxychorismate synthase component I [Aquibacillus salsiterrae]MDC3416203.1 aminodeoxychorismate synthase component I [Aquibacillus salsiterrae]